MGVRSTGDFWGAALASLTLAALGCSASTPSTRAEDAGRDRGDAGRTDADGLDADVGLDGLDDVGHYVLRGARVFGRAAIEDVEVDEGIIVAIEAMGAIDATGASSLRVPIVDVTGKVLVPAFVDAHVHLAYRPAGGRLLARGVAAVLDLAAPLEFLPPLARGGLAHAPLAVISSGPMITAVDGYPTESWGRDGYGLEVATPDEGARAVEQLFAAGAKLVKVPLGDVPSLDDATLAAVVERAHALGLRVAVHALYDGAAARAARAGADLLAHTPVEAMSDETVALWAGRAVVSTLGAFGARPETIDNLARLRAAGATVLYGTDLGNTVSDGIDLEELALLEEAGLSRAEVVDAATRVPAAWLGLDRLGAIDVGKAASFLVVDRDPLEDPAALGAPHAVFIDGRRVEP